MKFLRNLTLSVVAVLVAFVALGSWAVHEKADRVAAAAQPVEVATPTASQARASCRMFIDRRMNDISMVYYADWRVKAPAHGSNRWQVVAEFRQDHGGGATTMHRALCLLEFNPANGWRLVKLA